MGGKKIAYGDAFHFFRLTYGNQKEKSHRLRPAGYYLHARLQKESFNPLSCVGVGHFYDRDHHVDLVLHHQD